MGQRWCKILDLQEPNVVCSPPFKVRESRVLQSGFSRWRPGMMLRLACGEVGLGCDTKTPPPGWLTHGRNACRTVPEAEASLSPSLSPCQRARLQATAPPGPQRGLLAVSSRGRVGALCAVSPQRRARPSGLPKSPPVMPSLFREASGGEWQRLV